MMRCNCCLNRHGGVFGLCSDCLSMTYPKGLPSTWALSRATTPQPRELPVHAV